VAPTSVDEQHERSGTTVGREDHERRAEVFAPPEGTKRFVLGLLITVLVSLLAVGLFNVIVDPWGTIGTRIFPTAIESDRSTKITLLQRLRKGPDILILGSSRSRTAEPAYLQQLTGESGFNAGVTGGNAVDEMVFTRMMYDRFPTNNRRYLIFVSAGLPTQGVNPQLISDPRAQPFLPPGAHGPSLAESIKDYLSVDATEDSFRVVRACLEGVCHHPWFHADGSLRTSRLLGPKRQAARLRKRLGPRLERIRFKKPRVTPTAPSHYRAFEDLLRWMNQHGARPVVVFTPFHPAVERVLAANHDLGHSLDVEYLRSLQKRLNFVFIDLWDIKTFGGDPNGFYDPTHVDVNNMRRMLTYVVEHDQGVL
jgi:hypothetical protein